MVDVQDLLARNAMLGAPFQYFAGGKSNFGNLAANDIFDIGYISDIHLGMSARKLNIAA